MVEQLIVGDFAVDDRGTVSFVNDFDFAGVKRFYTIIDHRAWVVRAWHAHRREAKFITVVRGAALVGVVAVDDWENPSRSIEPSRHVLSAQRPAVLRVPPGHANGIMALQDGTVVVVFSTATLEESLADDVRFPPWRWDIWGIEDR